MDPVGGKIALAVIVGYVILFVACKFLERLPDKDR